MSNHFSRRQFFKHSQVAFLGFSTLGMASAWGYAGLAQTLKNISLADNISPKIEAEIYALMQKKVVPGAAIALIQNSQLVWSRGFGVRNINTQSSVNNQTVFACASLSKPLFAYAAMKMCASGLLNLDTPLTEYTAKPYISDPRIKLITTRMVLSHTTGFPNWSGDQPVWIDFTPGSRFQYSSEGFLYLQSVVEEITQQPLNDYMDRHIFAPLDMTSSSYIWQNRFENVAANGHDEDGNPEPLRRPSKAVSAGSLRTTANDYAKFLIAMLQPGTKESFLLDEANLNLMTKPHIKISQSLAWGLGWGIEKTPNGDFFWHWGDSGVYKSFTFGSRSLQTAIVILTNAQNGLRIAPEVVNKTIGGEHPAFSFGMIDY